MIETHDFYSHVYFVISSFFRRNFNIPRFHLFSYCYHLSLNLVLFFVLYRFALGFEGNDIVLIIII